MKPFRVGKVKEVYEISDKLIFHFTDNISVFDKIIPTKIKDKGATLCGEASFWFKKCKNIGVATHYIETPEANKMVANKFNILKRVPTIEDTNYLIPLEVIARHYVAGSFFDRNKGKYKYGEKLDEPTIEFTTKFESYDRLLDEREAMVVGGLKKDDLESIKETVLKVDDLIGDEVKKRGLIHVDGKKEFAFDKERQLVLVDVFGTPDEDRFWDKAKYEEGEFVEMSKEFVRQYYKNIEYYKKLKNARERGKPEPEIPPLPEEISNQVSELYRKLYKKITGQEFDEYLNSFC